MSLEVEKDKALDRRFVSLIWYIPIFMGWQYERVRDKGGDMKSFIGAANKIQAVIEDILGVP